MNKQRVWLSLVAANVIIYLLQLGTSGGFDQLFMLSGSTVAARPWTLITSMFLHGSILHLLLNMWALFVFGSLLEPKIGAKKFLAVYFVAGLLANAAFLAFYPANIFGLGASGAIFGIIGALTVLEPNIQLLVFFIPMPLWIAAILWALYDLVLLQAPGSAIANAAHLGGLAAGLAAGYYLKSRDKTVEEDVWAYSRSRGY
ncbi:hypothetical protein AUJ14_04600 [Candidatus Micrarchaeota archaeon CG1_02_55_22]|nr:MAG: hypothetical protein AUJ14_04600 [Candidatus Micrarchaeota archaeon CG1_02_55_22]